MTSGRDHKPSATGSDPPDSGERRGAASPPGEKDISLTAIRQHLQSAGEHVGDLLWWTLEDARITRSRLEAVWNDAGLSPSFLPRGPDRGEGPEGRRPRGADGPARPPRPPRQRNELQCETCRRIEKFVLPIDVDVADPASANFDRDEEHRPR